MENFQILTPHLILRPLAPSDAEALLAYRHLPQVTIYQTWAPESLDEAQTFIEKYAFSNAALGKWGQLAITLKPELALVGDCGFQLFEAEQAEIGITLAPQHQGQGYAIEALGALLGYLFSELSLHRIVARTDPANHASMRLLERLGFRHEGLTLQSIKIRGEWKDDALFGMLRDEWESNK
jgi:RimJ/RimL family protein N-acetyltransferase